jgi:hypothetical protein
MAFGKTAATARKIAAVRDSAVCFYEAALGF